MANAKESLVDTVKKSEMNNQSAPSGQSMSESSETFLQLFLKRIKLFALAKTEHPGLRLNVDKIKELDANLTSPNKEVRDQAFQEIDILFQFGEDASSKTEITSLETIVDGSSLNDQKKVGLKVVAQQIEASLANNTPKTSAELERIYQDLETVREALGERNLGVNENAVGLEYLENKLSEIHARKEIVDYQITGSEFRGAPLDKYADQFEAVTKNSDLVQVRVSWNPNLNNVVTEFRKNVREELLSTDRDQKLLDLSGEDSLERIKRVGELKSHMHELHGDRWVRGASADRISDIHSVLDTVHGEYQLVLAQKIRARLKSQNNGDDVLNHVPTAVIKVIESRRVRGHSTYEFGANDTFDNISQQVLVEAQKMKKEIPRRRVAVPRADSDDMASMEEQVEYQDGGKMYQRSKELQEKVKKFQAALAKTDYKLDSPEFLRDIQESDGIDRIIADMQQHGLSPDMDTLNTVREALTGYQESLTGPEHMDMKTELDGLLAEKKYSEAINLTMEFLARIGLREASSDWQLAVTLRIQKDIISRINSDAGEAFEARQHLLFLPNPNGLSHEKFGEVMAQVLTKSNLDYALSPANVFMLGTQVQIGEQTLNINSAMFKDLLRSEAASMRLLNADVNSTDSTLRGILAEHIWGKGTLLLDLGKKVQLPNGQVIDLTTTKAKMKFFDIDQIHSGDNYGKLMDGEKEVTLLEMFERTNWMMKDAQQFWWYGREWEKHLVNYPKNRMRNAPKKIASMGRMLSAYNGEFEKYDRSMAKFALLGTLLQPGEVYKIHTTVGANVRDILVEKYKKDGIWGTTVNGKTYNADRAKKIGDLMVNLVTDKVTIEGEEFVVDTLSQEAVRLVGNEINTNTIDGFYTILKDRYIGMKMDESEIPSIEQMRNYYSTWMNTKDRTVLDDEKLRFWGAQAEEMAAWIDMRKFNPNDMNLINSISPDELKPFLERESLVFGRTRTANSLREFFQGNDNGKTGFEFTSIMDPKKLDQGDDTFQYGANYYPRSLKAADLFVKFLNLESSNEERLELFGTMQGYVPADVLRKFMTVGETQFLRAQSIQAKPFEVAHEAGKWVMQDNGKKEWIKTDSPNAIDYITLTDSNGEKWQVKGRNGERVYVKEMTKRFHSFAYDQKEKWILRESDIDVDLTALSARGYISRDKKEDMMATITGVGQGVDNFLQKLGIDTKKGGGRKARKIITKLIGLIKKHPLFDDPVWAFWSITNTMWEYVKEVSKEVGKEAIK